MNRRARLARGTRRSAPFSPCEARRPTPPPYQTAVVTRRDIVVDRAGDGHRRADRHRRGEIAGVGTHHPDACRHRIDGEAGRSHRADRYAPASQRLRSARRTLQRPRRRRSRSTTPRSNAPISCTRRRSSRRTSTRRPSSRRPTRARSSRRRRRSSRRHSRISSTRPSAPRCRAR